MRPTLLLTISAILLAGFSPAPPKRSDPEPGEGVLCMAVFIYLAEQQGRLCHPGADPDYQQRLARYAADFDAYIARNIEGGAPALQSFRKGQGVAEPADPRICEGGNDYAFYEHLREVDAAEMDAHVRSLLSRDGPPRFGDCV